MATLLISGCGEDKTVEQPASPAQVEQEKFFANGQFKVGTEITTGEYIAVGTGYVEVAKDSSGDVNNILVNDNIEDARRYVVVNDGEYVKLTGDLKLYPVDDAPKVDTGSNLLAGQYKVGVDIPAGEYKIMLEAGGYYAVTKDTRRAYVKNQFTNEGGQFYATVADGQYLQIKKGTAEFVGAAAPKAEQLVQKSEAPPAPTKILNLGMTLDEFKQAYKSNSIAITGKQFSIDNAQVKVGFAQDVFQCNITPNLIVMGAIDKSTGLIKESWVLCSPDEILDGLIAYGLIISVVNPELTTEQRGELMLELKIMDERIKELSNGTVNTIRGNVKYTTGYIPQRGFMFTASARDL